MQSSLPYPPYAPDKVAHFVMNRSRPERVTLTAAAVPFVRLLGEALDIRGSLQLLLTVR